MGHGEPQEVAAWWSGEVLRGRSRQQGGGTAMAVEFKERCGHVFGPLTERNGRGFEWLGETTEGGGHRGHGLVGYSGEVLGERRGLPWRVLRW